ncbi:MULTISPECIES: DNA adenine methylase [Corynebacterium]|uniref:DNA adenine methylase n=1 Tax=Corynebacterium TaxID=1716 RepID=UPI001314F3D4|nr:DNA adenine methylase [Corynebacterium hadale]
MSNDLHKHMPLTKTPLRYPGGKSQLRPVVKSLIDRSSTDFAEYIEPFCGGSGIAMDLLLNKTVERVWINDLDQGIYSFWHALVAEPDRLMRWIEDVPLTMTEWNRQREIIEGSENVSGYDFNLGAAYFFMSRTNRSGVIRGGVIGGKEQKGRYKLDCRFNKTRLLGLVRAISSESDRIRVTNLNGLDVVTKPVFPDTQPESCLVYADPPYVQKAEGLYMNFFEESDHVKLSYGLKNSLFPYWFATYDDDPLIRRLYSDHDPENINVTYSAQVKRRAAELLIMSAQLRDTLV